MRRATSAKRATQRLRRTVKKPLDMKTQDKLRKALRAKCGPRPDERFFRKYDRDRSGELSVQEVEEMFRTGLKITKREASPADVRALVAAMDADGSGTLSLAELAAFVGNRPVSPGKSKMKRRMIKKTTAFFPSSNANEPLAPPYRRPHTHFDAEALKRFRDGVHKSLAHIRTDARTALENSNSQKSENLSPRSMLRFLREDLDVPKTLVRDGDALELLKLADVDDYGTLALDDLAAFVEKGPRAFYNAQALPGKSVQLPKPPGADSQRFGRVVGALEARLENGDTRKRFAAVDHDGDGKVKVEAFREAVRGSALHLTEDDLDEEDLDALVQMIDKNPGGRKVYEVDVRKLALLSKRGGDAISDLYDAEKQFLRKTANDRKKAIQRRTAEDRYKAWDAAQPKPDPNQKIPALGQRLIPCNLFAWLDDPVGYVAPLDAPKLSSKDDSTGPSDLQALIKLRNALQLHEALGQSLAAGSVLLKMGRRLRDRSLARYFPRGAHRAKELRCAGEALDAASSLFRTYFDDATHHLSLTALYEAADAFLEAEDELVNSLSKVRGPVPDDLDDDAASERSLLLRFAERSLAEFKEAHSLLDVTALTPKEIARYANGLALVAVVQSRQPLHEGAQKVQRSFGDAERLHAALQGDVASLCKAEFQKRRAFERSRAGYPAEALEAMRAREELLESALGVDHVETAGARRLRVLWSRGLGAGAGIGGNAPQVVA